MRRWAVTAAVVAVGLAAWPGMAASQETTTTTEATTTTTEATTTTVAPTTTLPESTTTVPETTTTTAVPSTTTTTIPAPPVLFGDVITDGSLAVDVAWLDDSIPACQTTVPLGGGQMNRVNDLDGDLGLVYGQAATGTGTAAAFVMELGVVPFGVGILSMADATCNLDAIGVGSLVKTPGSLSISGIGVGMSAGNYDRNEAIQTFSLAATVATIGGPATVDAQSLYDFLIRPRQ